MHATPRVSSTSHVPHDNVHARIKQSLVLGDILLVPTTNKWFTPGRLGVPEGRRQGTVVTAPQGNRHCAGHAAANSPLLLLRNQGSSHQPRTSQPQSLSSHLQRSIDTQCESQSNCVHCMHAACAQPAGVYNVCMLHAHARILQVPTMYACFMHVRAACRVTQHGIIPGYIVLQKKVPVRQQSTPKKSA